MRDERDETDDFTHIFYRDGRNSFRTSGEARVTKEGRKRRREGGQAVYERGVERERGRGSIGIGFRDFREIFGKRNKNERERFRFVVSLACEGDAPGARAHRERVGDSYGSRSSALLPFFSDSLHQDFVFYLVETDRYQASRPVR